MSQGGDWTPFCVPWTWYHARRFCWRCPQGILVSCVVDGIPDKSPPLAGVMHRDKQLGFVAQLNHMALARKFFGTHLVDVDRSGPDTPSRLTFYLTRGPCPCHRQQQQHQQAQPAQAPLPTPTAQPQPAVTGAVAVPRPRQQGPGAGVAAAVDGSGGGSGATGAAVRPVLAETGTGGVVSGGSTEEASDHEGDHDGSESDSGRASSASSTSGSSDGGGGENRGRQRRAGGVRGSGRGGAGGAARGVRRSSLAADVRPHGPGAPQQRLCRCPCHAGWLTQVLVSRADVEEMGEKRRAVRPYRKQQAGEAGGHDGRTGPAAGADRRPLPRMTPSPLETAIAAAPQGAGVKGSAGSGGIVRVKRLADIAGSGGSGGSGGGGGIAGSGGGDLPYRLSSVNGYRTLGPSVCSVPARSGYTNISARIVAEHMPNETRVRIAVEVDGMVPPHQQPYPLSRLVAYSANRRLMPTPPLAVGKLCIGWGMLPGAVLVMRVVTMPAGGVRQGGGGGVRSVLGKRTAAGAEREVAVQDDEVADEDEEEDKEASSSSISDKEDDEESDSDASEWADALGRRWVAAPGRGGPGRAGQRSAPMPPRPPPPRQPQQQGRQQQHVPRPRAGESAAIAAAARIAAKATAHLRSGGTAGGAATGERPRAGAAAAGAAGGTRGQQQQQRDGAAVPPRPEPGGGSG